MESGYVRTGKPSKIDIGPINTLISFNTVEGVRLRAGGMTMSPLNPHLLHPDMWPMAPKTVNGNTKQMWNIHLQLRKTIHTNGHNMAFTGLAPMTLT